MLSHISVNQVGYSEARLSEIFQKIDANNSGKISLDEFLKYFGDFTPPGETRGAETKGGKERPKGKSQKNLVKAPVLRVL